MCYRVALYQATNKSLTNHRQTRLNLGGTKKLKSDPQPRKIPEFDLPTARSSKIMAGPRQRGLNGASQSSHPPAHVAERLVESDASSNDPMEKDVTEEELERLVFGNESGFRDALKSRKAVNRELAILPDNETEDGEAQLDGKEGVGDVDDADVGFILH